MALFKLALVVFAVVVFALIALTVIDTDIARWAAGGMAAFVASFLPWLSVKVNPPA